MKKYLAVDLGRTHLKYAVITEELDVLNEGKLAVPVDNKEKLFNAYKQVADLYRGQVEGMALTMPGVIDMEKGFAYSGGVYLWVRNMSYGEELSQYISMKVAICNDAKAAALELREHLKLATNVNTGKLDISKFNMSLQKSNTSLISYVTHLQNLGPAGQQSFRQLTNAILSAEVPAKKLNKLFSDLLVSFKNTFTWQISSSVLNSSIIKSS